LRVFKTLSFSDYIIVTQSSAASYVLPQNCPQCDNVSIINLYSAIPRSNSIALSKKKTVLSQGNRAMPQLFFGLILKFADNIHYKFKSSQASKARLQRSKHAGEKQNLIGHTRSFKVTCFEVS